MFSWGFLPILSIHGDAASFTHSVLPFYSAALEHISEYRNIVEIYATTNPFVTGTFLSVVVSISVFLISSYTGNYSWVDRLWSILPVFYSLHYYVFASLHGLVSERLLVITGLQFLWGMRLTFNYWRKGGYTRGSEDYRWIYVRKLVTQHFPPVLAEPIKAIFNLVFISFIQNALLFAMTAPNYLVLLIGSATPINYQDIICSVAVVISLAIETLADEQQWIYQTAKHAKPSKSGNPPNSHVSYCQPEDLKRGFLTGGLFRYSRHPNFTCEQLNWYLFYAFGCIATRTLWNWTAAAPLTLTGVIFIGSTILTEWITSQKYPEYKLYQKKVGKFIPLPGYVWDKSDDTKKVR